VRTNGSEMLRDYPLREFPVPLCMTRFGDTAHVVLFAIRATRVIRE
jgi:hypothetical protein